MKRALSVTNIYNKKRTIIELPELWRLHLGNIERTGTIIIWGNSGHGKTTYVMKLAKMLAKYTRVAYNSLEEKDGLTLEESLRLESMEEVGSNFIILNDNYTELKERLSRPKAPKVVIIDSLQYLQITYADYIALKEEFNNTLFIFISHAEGKQPEGKVAKKVRYDSNIKIQVEGYTAFVTSRYGGGEPFVIWAEKADHYHGGLEKLTNTKL